VNVAIGVGSAGGAPRGTGVFPAAATSSRRSSPTARAACPDERVVTVVGRSRSASIFEAAFAGAFLAAAFADTLVVDVVGFVAGLAFSFGAGTAGDFTAAFLAFTRARGGCRLLRDPLEATCALGAGCLPEPCPAPAPSARPVFFVFDAIPDGLRKSGANPNRAHSAVSTEMA
jgi:hypothetical protein